MTLDEAIKHCEDVIKEKEENAKYYKSLDLCKSKALVTACKECAEEHQQLAEWLKELKELRNVLDKIRAEIADLDDADYDYEGYYKVVTDAVKIIDKYKTESEDKE